MATNTIKKQPPSMIVQGRNASGKIIEGTIPAGEVSSEDPGLAIQKVLAKHKNILPTPILPGIIF